MKKNTIFFFFSLFMFALHGQDANFNSQRNWSLNKKELQFGFGATQFNGDLGGAEGIGSDYSLKDIDWPSTGLALLLGYRQRFHPYFATTTSLSVFNLKGNDSLSEELMRNARNLHFKSIGIEIQQRLEFIFAANEKFGSTYNLPGNYSKKNRSQQYYVFGGIGLCYFNPKAQNEDGEWTALRPLRTEGQDKAYLPFTLTLPVGFGFRIGVSKMWRVGVELAYVKTFTDYMDDVSTTYADPSILSPEAAALANPTSGNPSFAPGQKRGDPNQKDAYYHMNVVITRNFTYKDYGKQRKKLNLKSAGKYKV
ncbi:MAG: hypothetical protein QNK70_04965 [Crocinitomicaceae bacterium]|tara:strand:+ start:2653 stop:3579 length:927 start_codon:yes stop_codon:yes gene_type:complete